MASKEGHIHIVKELLQRGAHVGATTKVPKIYPHFIYNFSTRKWPLTIMNLSLSND